MCCVERTNKDTLLRRKLTVVAAGTRNVAGSPCRTVGTNRGTAPRGGRSAVPPMQGTAAPCLSGTTFRKLHGATLHKADVAAAVTR